MSTSSTQNRAVGLHQDLAAWLDHMIKIDATDLYLTVGSPPVFRVENATYPGRTALAAEAILTMAESLMSSSQRDAFRASGQVDLSTTRAEQRFRINLFKQRSAPGMVVRRSRIGIKTLDELGLSALKPLAAQRRGLILLFGERGSGRSSAFSAFIDHRNQSAGGHILVIEDPIEVLHPHKQCVVTQREVSVDTTSYKDALRSAARQAPDLIAVDEIRDGDVLDALLGFAERGYACITTLPATSAGQAIERLVSLLPSARHTEVRLRLSLVVRAVIGLRLVTAGKGRLPAVEVALDTQRVRDLIKRGEYDSLAAALEQSGPGCCTFDGSLVAMVRSGRVTAQDALAAATAADKLKKSLASTPEQAAAASARDDTAPLRLLP